MLYELSNQGGFITCEREDPFCEGGDESEHTFNKHDTTTQIACINPTDPDCIPVRIKKHSLRNILGHAGLYGTIFLVCEIAGIRKPERA